MTPQKTPADKSNNQGVEVCSGCIPTEPHKPAIEKCAGVRQKKQKHAHGSKSQQSFQTGPEI